MYSIKGFTPREYQQSVIETAKVKNTLLCLPTGTGKTKTAILLAIHRLNSFSDSKILFLTPTKPLVNQIAQEYQQATNIPSSEISTLTGAVPKIKRKAIWGSSKVIVATPQTIEHDLSSKSIDLSNCTTLIIDECHRSKQRYANTIIAKTYMQQSQYPRILALTASPGSDPEKIREVCENLFIEAVEIRSAEDEDVQPYIQEKKLHYIKLDLPPAFLEIRQQVHEIYKAKVEDLKKFGLTKPASIINKRDLLMFQAGIATQASRNKSLYWALSLTAQAIKLSYILELIETQSPKAAYNYLKKLETEKTKASKIILSDPRIKSASHKLNEMVSKNIQHPKMIALLSLLKQDISQNPAYKAIVFANYRSSVSEIVEMLSKNNISAAKFVGQASKQDKGLSQQEQLLIIQQFKSAAINILVASSVAEEGLDIPEVNSVIFYEPIPSELRRIQRTGRTGRTKPGKVVYLITNKTRDEAYFWTAQRKEKKMHATLKKWKGSEFQGKLPSFNQP